ncbi:MAG: class II fructose-bisphosphate aldolase [Sedimentisphaerales bacterium]|nr:class II fructose-bisphosphate aldolase [Sedimentisphaerales bacterium]
MKTLLQKAAAEGYAIGYFEAWSLDSLQGVIDAAEETHSPVILGYNGDFMCGQNRVLPEHFSPYGAMAVAVAEAASVPCGVILNECSRKDWLTQAIDIGFNMVMPVEPSGDMEAYQKLTQEIVDYAHPRGAVVEVELGELPCGLEDAGLPHENTAKTEPNQAAKFIKDTGADLLAVSVGNVHIDVNGANGNGLDFDLMAAIRKEVSVPLVLHGGTGISAGALKKAISMGVVKLNYGTYIKQRYLAAIRKAIGNNCEDPHRLLGLGGEEDLLVAGRKAVKDAVLERISLLGCCGKA